MKSRNYISVLLATSPLIVFVCLLFIPSNYLYAQQESKLEKAQWLYQHENYEEALVLLKELRGEQPRSSEAAYYLGLTYKRLQDFLAAKPHLEAAVNLKPSVKNALPELIDLLYQCDKVEEAKKWIAYAEKESVTPAQTAFFKGLVLLKEGEDPQGAIDAFEEAEELDPTLARTVKYQKGLAYMQLKDFKQAKSIFREIVVKEPAAGLAEFANEYIDAIAMSEDAAKRFRGSVSYSMQYDDNLILRPEDESLSAGVDEDKSMKHVVSARGNYTFKPSDDFGLKVGLSFYGAKHDTISFYDTTSVDIPIQPIFYFEDVTVSFPVHYNMVRINDRNYVGTMGFGNLNNIMLAKDRMLQFHFQFNYKDHHWSPSDVQDTKTGCEYMASTSLYHFFGQNNEGMISGRYAFTYEDTDGNNYRSSENRFTLSTVVPIVDKLKLNSAVDYKNQDYLKVHTNYGKKRRDGIISVSNMFTYEVVKDTELQLQHTYVFDDSNVAAFKYDRNVYGLGVKYKF